MLSAKKGTAAGLCAAILCLGPVRSGAQSDGLVRAVDDIPPAPATGLTAVLMEDNILLTWTASDDDNAVGSTFGGQYVYRNLVHGYRVYRGIDGGEPSEIGSTPAGITEYTDSDITAGGGVYVYDVRAYDSDNEAMLVIEPGSEADRARTVTPAPLPRDAEGNLVLGWFSYEGARVGLDDFFLLHENLGRQDGDEGFDPVYDLNADGVVGFNDFFIFSEHFSTEIANAVEVQEFITSAGTAEAINAAIAFQIRG